MTTDPAPAAPRPPARPWGDRLAGIGVLPLALGVSALVVLALLLTGRTLALRSLGDTDDAMRLVLVRDLLAGRSGWFDLHVPRLQPPLGLDMHWSRLVDGGQAALQSLFQLVLPPARAETALRLAWPLLWVLPVVWPTLALARHLGGRPALWVAAVLLLLNLPLFVQWRPGRLDHHSVQAALTLAALAGFAIGGRFAGLLAGAACGLALAVGIESLPFQAVVGGAFALRFALDPSTARAARGYGLGLLVAATLAYGLQTPPGHWAAAACDVLAVNLWAGLALAGAGLALTAALAARAGPAVRWGGLVLTGLAAAGAYVGLDPACLGGPLGAVDPRLGPVWLDHISEMRPLLAHHRLLENATLMSSVILGLLGLLAALGLGLGPATRTPAWLAATACLVLAVVGMVQAERMAGYAGWFALPLAAAGFAALGERLWRGRLTLTLAAAVFLSPSLLVPALAALAPARSTGRDAAALDACDDIAAFTELAALPPGLVLAETDMGPHILANTPHAALSAPYHRMGWGILAAHDALAAPPGEDAARSRRLGIGYVATCLAHARRFDHAGLGADSLQARLDRGEVPAWLVRASRPGAAIVVYRVRGPHDRP